MPCLQIDSYVCLLKAMGLLILWQTYQEKPPNMDELGNDTTKHRKKVIVGKTQEAKEMQTFVKIPKGDGCMPWHITMCLTTRANGKQTKLG